MGKKEMEIILKELHDFRKEINDSIRKIFDKIDSQNERLVSCEKDFQYLSEKTQERDEQLLKDFTEFFLRFKDFKNKGVPDMIKAEALSLKLWILVPVLTATIGIITFFAYEFLKKL